MKIINQSIKIMDPIDGELILEKLELAGRVCYKSENGIKEGSKKKFLKSIIDRGHESVLEHESITVRLITDRATAMQITRHRLASYSIESQRYVNYSKDRHEKQITFIRPVWMEFNSDIMLLWEHSCKESENSYFKILEKGATPEQAREVLPNSTKTEIVMTMNIRSWRNFLKLRTDKAAGPSIRQLAGMILKELKQIPILFDDIGGK